MFFTLLLFIGCAVAAQHDVVIVIYCALYFISALDAQIRLCILYSLYISDVYIVFLKGIEIILPLYGYE